MTTQDYIAPNNVAPEWVISLHEYMTILASSALALALVALTLQFIFYNSKLDILLSRAFLSDLARTVVTFAMGISLYFDWAGAVKWLVIIRPYVLFIAAYYMFQLYFHYREIYKRDDI